MAGVEPGDLPGAWRRLALLGALALVTGCAGLAPLRDPPAVASADAMRGLTTRTEVLARLGPPTDVLPGDPGQVLVYRRAAEVDLNPNRAADRIVRFERLLIFVDPEGRVSRWTVEPD
jgi:hypothetical protein